YQRTRNLEFISRLWPHIELALEWIDHYGDKDGDGFVEYTPSPNGLINKGWKDSHDSVMHSDGSPAPPPIALVEVQGYVYQAKLHAASLAKALGMEEKTQKLEKEARVLADRFIKAFWDQDMGCYVLALDGEKRPCRVRTSNAGHTLFSGIAPERHAKELVETLFSKTLFSGWGIRTLASSEVLYNPLSYHNGSVWPHDNAIIALGLSQYGFKEGLLKILKGLFEASLFFRLNRLPELFCGFPKRAKEGPTPYPVACNPQAWAAGAAFMLLQACLGVTFKENQLLLRHPVLPPFLEEVHIKGLTVGGTSVDLSLRRSHGDVVVNVLRKRKGIEVIITK
ncbi:MAG: amylo-alpha-1,6-glucosidase, partial [Aquificota bacterium]